MYLHMIAEYVREWWGAVRDRVRDGCSHQHVTWPQRPRLEGRTAATVEPGTAMSKRRCLDCGRYQFVDLSTAEPRFGTEWHRDPVREWPPQHLDEIVEHTQAYCGVLTITGETGGGR